MTEPLVEFAVDSDHPVTREEVIESLAAVLISARDRRREREQAKEEKTATNLGTDAGTVPA